MESLTKQEAYAAMFHFLADYYRRLNSDALGGLLGELQLRESGVPVDPAIVDEWQRAVDLALSGERPPVVKGLI